jgi:hypothetical protein
LQYLRDPKFHWPFQCLLCTKCFQYIDYLIPKHWKKEHSTQLAVISDDVTAQLRHRAFSGQEPPEAVWSRFVKQVTERSLSTNPFVAHNPTNIPAAPAPPQQVPALQTAMPKQNPPASAQQPTDQRIHAPEQVQTEVEPQLTPQRPTAPSPQPPAVMTPESGPPRSDEPSDSAQPVSHPHQYLTNTMLISITQTPTTEHEQHEVNRRPQRSNTKKRKHEDYKYY